MNILPAGITTIFVIIVILYLFSSAVKVLREYERPSSFA
jgi:hypothetical protein